MTARLGPPCWLVLLSPSTTLACPVCDTPTGHQVRAGILDANFASTLLAVLLPFPILLACVALIHFGWPSRRDQGAAHGSPHDP